MPSPSNQKDAVILSILTNLASYTLLQNLLLAVRRVTTRACAVFGAESPRPCYVLDHHPPKYGLELTEHLRKVIHWRVFLLQPRPKGLVLAGEIGHHGCQNVFALRPEKLALEQLRLLPLLTSAYGVDPAYDPHMESTAWRSPLSRLY